PSLHAMCCFLFNHTATPEISTLSLHDALPILVSIFSLICSSENHYQLFKQLQCIVVFLVFIILHRSIVFHIHITAFANTVEAARSEEHTSELQSRENLVCRLLLEKKKKIESKK